MYNSIHKSSNLCSRIYLKTSSFLCLEDCSDTKNHDFSSGHQYFGSNDNDNDYYDHNDNAIDNDNDNGEMIVHVRDVLATQGWCYSVHLSFCLFCFL